MTAGSTEVEKREEAAGVTLEAWLVTDVGMVREHNEDSATVETSDGVFIVADGMGGHAAGEVASAMAVENVKASLLASKTEIDAFRKAPSDTGRRTLVQVLQNAVLKAHQAVYQRGQAESDKQGMGTTLDVLLVAGAEAFVAHVGDSRTYLVREGRSSQITTDHTVAEVLVIEGKLTIEEAQVSPLRTILVNAIGVSADVGVEMAHVTLKRGDRLLLCSDGLHDYFPAEEEIAQRLSSEQPGDALAEMVELAKTRGGHDNITGVAVHVVAVDNVPSQVTDDETQPVDGSTDGTNPFTTEETTQNTFPADGPTLPGIGAVPTRKTNPMSIATAPTDPPPMPADAKPIDPVAPLAKPAEAAAKPAEAAATPAGAKSAAADAETIDATVDTEATTLDGEPAKK